MKNKKRILKSEPILSQLLMEGDQFYVGLLFEDFIKSAALDKYRLSKTFIADRENVPDAKGPTTKKNTKGKFVRKHPEEKTTRRVHIKYTRKDGTHVEFDRDFNVYVKELLHQYKVPIKFATNLHGQELVISPILKFDSTNENCMKNTHVINMFLEMFNDFEIFTENLEPAIGFNKKYEFPILPKGEFNDTRIDEIVKGASTFMRDEENIKEFQRRLKILQRLNPDIRGKGPDGFWGYIVFGFEDKKVIVLESMYRGNATYIFDNKNYEELMQKDKQFVLKNKLAKRRFFHLDNWEENITDYLKP